MMMNKARFPLSKPGDRLGVSRAKGRRLQRRYVQSVRRRHRTTQLEDEISSRPSGSSFDWYIFGASDRWPGSKHISFSIKDVENIRRMVRSESFEENEDL